MKQKYTVAMVDVLGFSDMVQTNSLDRVVDQEIGWLRQAMCHAIIKHSWPRDQPTLEELNGNALVGVAWFSDTMLFWTKEDHDDNLRELIQTVAWITFLGIGGRTKLRGGVAYGEAFIDFANSLFIGAPIIEAHETESKQQWSGVALTKSAVERIPLYCRDGHCADWPVIPYAVPLKKLPPWSTLAINWTYGIHRELDLRWSSERHEPTDHDWEVRRDICAKWFNTRKFHDDVCSQCWRNRRTS